LRNCVHSAPTQQLCMHTSSSAYAFVFVCVPLSILCMPELMTTNSWEFSLCSAPGEYAATESGVAVDIQSCVLSTCEWTFGSYFVPCLAIVERRWSEDGHAELLSTWEFAIYSLPREPCTLRPFSKHSRVKMHILYQCAGSSCACARSRVTI
jgi:hypothetical protein